VTLFGVALSFAKRRRGKSARSGIITTLIGCTALTILILAAVWLPEQIPFASGPPQPTDVATWKAKYDSARQALRAAEDSRDGFKKLFNAEENGRHDLYFMCGDLQTEISTLAQKGVSCSDVQEARWGSIVKIRLPGGGEVGLYQPKHPTALTLTSH